MTFPDYESIDYKQGLKIKMTVKEIENRIKIMKELLYPIDRSIEFTVETLEKKWKQDEKSPLYLEEREPSLCP